MDNKEAAFKELQGRESAVAYYLMLKGYPLSAIHTVFSHLLPQGEEARTPLKMPVFLSTSPGPGTVVLPFQRESERAYWLDEVTFSG